MGGDLIPLPLVRWRGRPGRDVAAEVFGCGDGAGFEVPRSLKVHSVYLGKLKFCGNAFVVIVMFFWVAYVDKGYLKHASVQGYSRLTIQHPVQNCNPLHSHCKSAMAAMDKLDYCGSGGHESYKHKGSDHKAHQVGCKYLDTFAVDSLNGGSAMGNLLIPTRISKFVQKENEECARKEHPCAEPYTVESEKHDFVADIEDYTLLIDHGYSCPELEIKGASWATLGFYVPFMNGTTDWTFPKNTKHQRPRPRYIECLDPKDASCFYSEKHQQQVVQENGGLSRIPLPKMSNLLNRTTDNYDATGYGKMVATQYGDIVKVKDLLDIAGIDLNSRNFGEHNLRTEGEVIVIEISYTNWNYFHGPNSLAPVYEYRIYHIPADSYKITRVDERNDGKRVVTDVHGIEVITRVNGNLGALSLKTLTLTLVELSILLGFVNWMLTCCAMNFGEHQGRQIDHQLCKDIYLDDRRVGIGSEDREGELSRMSKEVQPLVEKPESSRTRVGPPESSDRTLIVRG